MFTFVDYHVFSVAVCSPSATFAAWLAAWLAGSEASDDVLDALGSWSEEHQIVANDDTAVTAFDLPKFDEPPASPAQLLSALRRHNPSDIRLVLPVSGDARGLGGGGQFTKAALLRGEAVLFVDTGFGLVPQRMPEGLIRWTVFGLELPVHLEYTGLPEAEHGLTEAMRTCASALRDADVARERNGVRKEIAARARSATGVAWPNDTPGRALRVLQRAEEVAAIVAIALEDEPGGAVSASSAQRRADALRPLADAARTARCAAVNDSIRVLTTSAERQS